MQKILDIVLWLFIAPGDIAADWLGVSQDQNRHLVRMLINSLFWILVAVFGLMIWSAGIE